MSSRRGSEAERWAKAINNPLANWPGHCHGIATAVVQAGLVKGGVVTRGIWLGPIHPESVFRGRPFTGHSWIETRGKIVDPTRWAFEMVTPYIFRGDYGLPTAGTFPWYDKGGAVLRDSTHRGPPAHDADFEEIPLQFETGDAADRVRTLLPPDTLALEGDPYLTVNRAQFVWLANINPSHFGPYAAEVLEALARNNLAILPIDVRKQYGIGRLR